MTIRAIFVGSLITVPGFAASTSVLATTEPSTPTVVDCSNAGPGDPDESAQIHIEVDDLTDGFGGLGSRSRAELDAGPAAIEVYAAPDNPGPADLTVTRDGQVVVEFVSIAPGALCTATVELGDGFHVATSSVTADHDVDWTVGPPVVHGPAAELVDLTGVPGADVPIVVGETLADLGAYTDACDTLSAELITAALPPGTGTIGSIDHQGESSMTPAEGDWVDTCHWEVVVAGGVHEMIAVSIRLPFPEAISIDFGLVYGADRTDPTFVDLSSIAPQCYFIRRTASCPFGTYAIQVMVEADGQTTDEFQQASISLLANVMSRIQPPS